MEQDTVAKVERGVGAMLGAWIGVGVVLDLQRFLRRRQTFSTAIWILQRNRMALAAMGAGWLGLTLHLFVEPFLKAKKAKAPRLANDHGNGHGRLLPPD